MILTQAVVTMVLLGQASAMWAVPFTTFMSESKGRLAQQAQATTLFARAAQGSLELFLLLLPASSRRPRLASGVRSVLFDQVNLGLIGGGRDRQIVEAQ
ncbi:hypothetical protein [Bradyrhizobium sp. BR 1432]|uniref:hypothetical protein n=1 Tax=Bradyrhizobium sp. BR 1432 TaxID=3447966 RepID=UPI003EE59B25